MLFPSEMHETEMVNAFEVRLPWRAKAIADARRMEARKRRQVERAGLTMHEAIEMALRQRPRLRDRGAAARQPPTGRKGG